VKQIRSLTACGFAIALAAFLLPAGATASYGNGFDAVPGALLASADYGRLEQGDDTTLYAAVSADGRYVAMETFARNFFADDDPDPPGQYRTGGIFRFDLQTRALQKVADGNLFQEGTNAFLRRGAFSPSISANGRYVAFSTAQGLVPADTNGSVDVYVRDMNLASPAGGACTGITPPPCPYQLVSARDGSEAPADYEAPPSPVTGGNPGASTSRGVAISADGQRVVFRTEAPSDLPARAATDAPSGQIFVRDLSTQNTILVTATRDASTEQMTEQPAGGAVGAAISADGSTVAWTGNNAAAQTRFLGGENTDPTFYYYLWRRAPFGSSDPTRRITGLADPDDPVCRKLEEDNPGMTTTFDSTSTGPCYGPLTNRESVTDITSQLPALSADGNTVAFLTAAGPRPLSVVGLALDLYITRMNPGPSRKEATTELTRDAVNGDLSISAPITSLTISPGGDFLAITSSRTHFTLPVLQLVGEPRSVPGPHELYLIDLQQHTIERAAHSTTGGDIDGEILDGVTMSADASRIGFASFAGNLFSGDANQRADAFVATREAEPSAPGPSQSAGGGESSTEDLGHGPRISARVRSIRSDVAQLTVTVPGAGDLEAVATAPSGHGKRRKIADGSAQAKHRGDVKLTLRLKASLRAELSRDGRIRGRASIAFVPAVGGRRLTTSLPLTFFSKSSQLRHK
jgi:Tol biopolymer transport system component